MFIIMFKKIYIINLLLLTTFLLISFNNVRCEIVEINLTDDIPKNIMVGTFFNDKNHIKPMLDICTILVERGYNVILVSPDKFTLLSEYPNVKHVSLKLQIDTKDSIKDMPLQKYADAFNTYEKISRKYNIDLFLCDVMANDACLDVAHRLNKPLVGYGSFLLEFALKPKYDLNKKLKDSLFLANTFYGFELPKSLPSNVLEIGPVLSEKHPPLTRKLSSFLNSHNRILYVNLDMHGFTTENNSILLQSFIEAINENIIDGVIWLLPKTSFNKFFSTLKLSDGTLIHTSSILNSKNSNIYVMEFVPQFSILNHNNTKLFLNNGCAVSCYESLYAATPMLLIPRDNQMGYAEKLNTIGTGIILNQLQLNVKNILEKVDLMLKDEQIKRNVKKLENLTKINSKRKYKAADLIEYILHTNGENINEKSLKELKELITSDVQIGFNRKQLYDTYGNFILGIGFMIIGGIFYVVIRVIRLLVRIKIISVGLNVKKD